MNWDDILKNLQNSAAVNNNVGDQMADRARMAMNPGMQGPPLADRTADDVQQDKSIPGAMLGAVAPVAKVSPFAEQFAANSLAPSAVAPAEELANAAYQSGANQPIIAKAQAALSRARDFADRLRFQTLKRKLGQ